VTIIKNANQLVEKTTETAGKPVEASGGEGDDKSESSGSQQGKFSDKVVMIPPLSGKVEKPASEKNKELERAAQEKQRIPTGSSSSAASEGAAASGSSESSAAASK
jgi:hypothetical protein